jgi:hypothetical protein
MLSTHDAQIKGLQVVATITGASGTPTFTSSNVSGLMTVMGTVSGNQLIFGAGTPPSPPTPYSNSGNVSLGTLQFTAPSSGAVTITFSNANRDTYVDSYGASSSDIMKTPVNPVYTVAGAPQTDWNTECPTYNSATCTENSAHCVWFACGAGGAGACFGGGTLEGAACPVAADTEKPTIILVGSNVIEITVGGAYIEPGFSATDDVDGDISDNVAVAGGPVVTTGVHTYTLTYTVSDAAGNAADAKTRTVRIVNSPVEDTTAPEIRLNGVSPMEVLQGSVFTDPGATATDNVDTSVTVTASGTVDTAQPVGSSFTLTYNASDAAGNDAVAVTRTVTLTAQAPVVADADGNRLVNGDDFTVWFTHLFQEVASGVASLGDFFADGKINGGDYMIWRKYAR